jgi:WD40 repeat protein
MKLITRLGGIGLAVALAVASVLVIRAGLRPCAWLDRALKRSGCLATLEKRGTAVESVVFSPDGSLVATSARDDKVHLWRTADRTLDRTLEAPNASTKERYSYDVAFSPDGTILGLGLPDGTVRMWRMSDGSPVRTLEGRSGTVCSLEFSPDGRTLALGSSSGVIQLWQVADGRLAREFSDHAMQVLGLAFSSEGTFLASASLDGTAKLWRVADGVLVRTVEKAPVPTGVAFSADGSLLAINHQLWRVEDWTAIREMDPLRGGMGNVAFSPDGKTLAAGNGWHEVRWWRVADGVLLRAVEGHKDSVNSVAFSPDGERLASGSLDGTVHLWRVPEKRRGK